jgi:hypothetical protein
MNGGKISRLMVALEAAIARVLRRFPVLPNNTSLPPKKIKEAGARRKIQLVWPASRHISHISLRPSAPGCRAILSPRSIRQRTRGVRPAGGHRPEVQCQNEVVARCTTVDRLRYRPCFACSSLVATHAVDRDIRISQFLEIGSSQDEHELPHPYHLNGGGDEQEAA